MKRTSSRILLWTLRILCCLLPLLWAAACSAPQSVLPSSVPEVTQTAVVMPTIAQTPVPTPEPTPVPTPSPTPDPYAGLDAFIDSMSTEEKLGQLVMFGVTGITEADPAFAEIIRDYHVGNFILYGSNMNRQDGSGGFADAALLCGNLQELSPGDIPALISIDVEGGAVYRFTWDPETLSARKLGEKGDTRLAFRQFYRIGKKLRETGIHMDLAPVMDVAPSPMDTFLTTRIISSDPDIAGAIGSAAVAGLREAGCLSTLKHFPGHGGTNDDSHKITPQVKKSAEELTSYDLEPFRQGVDAGADVVLAAHILYPALDSESVASLSYPILTEILRQDMGFEGLILSDDFRMEGLKSARDIPDAAVDFIEAGGDLILCGAVKSTQKTIMESLLQAARDGRLSEERIRESVYRILQKKMKATDWRP